MSGMRGLREGLVVISRRMISGFARGYEFVFAKVICDEGGNGAIITRLKWKIRSVTTCRRGRRLKRPSLRGVAILLRCVNGI